MLANLLTWLWVILIFNQSFKQTLIVSYFTELVMGWIGNVPVKNRELYVKYSTRLIEGSFCMEAENKNRLLVLDYTLTWSWVNLVFTKWFNQALYISYYTDMILGSFGYGLANKIKHYVLATLMCLLRDNYITNQWIKADTVC